MRKNLLRLLVGTVTGSLAVAAGAAGVHADEAGDEYKVLVVGKTLGFRHGSIVPATSAIIELGQDNGFSVDVWDDRQPDRTLATTPFTSAEDLNQYATIVFVSTVDGTNDLNPARPTVLDEDELAAFRGYIQAGGGFVGIHGASDSMHTVPWYGGLVGGDAYFRNHPAQQTAVKHVEDPTHPSTEFLPTQWVRFDEWYNFTNNPRDVVRVLLTLDETSYNPGFGAMGDHPIAWCHNYEGGRSWYTAGGHRDDNFSEPLFLQHILGGVEWTAGITSGGGDCVTFYEVGNLVADVEAAGGVLNAVAARNVRKHLDEAEAAAADGDRTSAVKELSVAKVLAGALVRNTDDRDVLIGKLDDLIEWQEGLAEHGA